MSEVIFIFFDEKKSFKTFVFWFIYFWVLFGKKFFIVLIDLASNGVRKIF